MKNMHFKEIVTISGSLSYDIAKSKNQEALTMDVKKENIPGTAEVMMGDMDGMMGCPNPQATLAKIAEGERMEAALYAQIAQGIPSEQLRCIIMNKERHEACMARMLSMISEAFGTMPADPPGFPGYYAVNEKKGEK